MQELWSFVSVPEVQKQERLKMDAQELIDSCEDFDCKCGGEYCRRDSTWKSRVYCDKCNDYFDVSGCD